MKNLSKLLIVIAVLFCGCNTEEPAIKERPNMKVYHFEYNGHKYIEFAHRNGYAGFAGVVHDPDCPCHN